MTIQAYQHDILIMDRSGSISDILAGMQDGFREFCASQAALEAEGIRVTGSLWQFHGTGRGPAGHGRLLPVHGPGRLPGRRP